MRKASPTYGFCEYCRDRTGTRHFRELLQGVACKECCQKYTLLPTAIAERPKRQTQNAIAPAIDPSTAIAPSAEKERVKKRKEKPKKIRLSRKPKEKLAISFFDTLKQDEKDLVKVLSQIECGYRWRNLAEKELGWTASKVRTVSRRLLKKGYKIREDQEDRLMRIVCENPWSSAAELATMSGLEISWTSKILLTLVQKGALKSVKARGQKNRCLLRYGVEVEANCLFYDFKLKRNGEVACVCAYSQKFGGYGIFADLKWPAGIVAKATKFLDKPLIVVAPLLEFQTWVNAHQGAIALYPGKPPGITFSTNYALSDLVSEATKEFDFEEIAKINILQSCHRQCVWRIRNLVGALKSSLLLVTEARDLYAIARSGQLRIPNGKVVSIDIELT